MYEIYILTFIFGLILGSFYNVVALRTLSGEKLAFPPSHCTNCNHKLGFFDLFPLFSFLFLGGKCRYCKHKISPVYPFGELLTATSYTLIIYKFGLSMNALIQILFITFLMFSTITDIKETIVPDRFIVIGLITVGTLRLIHGEDIIFYLISALVSFVVLFLILILSGGKMGGADVKLYALIGLSIGWVDSMGSLFYASIIALIVHLFILLKNKGKFDRSKEIPFVPFITLGVLCTYFLNFFKF